MPSFIKKSLSSLKSRLTQWLPEQWQQNTWAQWFLLPLAAVFFSLIKCRKALFRLGLKPSVQLPVPVIVVGNISVGGTGKTPLTIHLVNWLKSVGYKPGIISRGYGRESDAVMPVAAESAVEIVGDEPLLLAKATASPVYVGADRVLAAQALLQEHPDCNVLVSDDGLQHYRLQRQFELVVVDAKRGFGNGRLLPAGPLREPLSRLASVDAIVVNGSNAVHLDELHRYSQKISNMQLKVGRFYQLIKPINDVEPSFFYHRPVLVLAGIGNPARFFDTLTSVGIVFDQRVYADHHAFSAGDFADINAELIIMTEKDAVKCQPFADERFWVLSVEAELTPMLTQQIQQRLSEL